MHRHDFETQIPQARALTDEELRQTQGGSFSSAIRGVWSPIIDPLPPGLRGIWNRVWGLIKEIS
ncbi:MAG TPA: hypothetical protein VFS67_34310 [Polyangiaceae bacterium]|nr:hypothetical protein [Polyangiaceae bacterium]